MMLFIKPSLLRPEHIVNLKRCLAHLRTARRIEIHMEDVNGGKELLAGINAQIEALRAQLHAA